MLAAETAIGKHPVGAVDMVLNMIERFRHSLGRLSHRGSARRRAPRCCRRCMAASRSTPGRHGGDAYRGRQSSRGLPAIEVDVETAMDIEQIATASTRRSAGFMTQAELESVLDNYRLPGGDVWTMPIVLQGKSQEFAAFQPGQSVRLIDHRTGQTTAILHLEDKYEIDPRARRPALVRHDRQRASRRAAIHEPRADAAGRTDRAARERRR